MALVISDRIKETTNTVGTQTYQLEGAVTGFETFASNLSDGDTTYYAVTDNTNFEVGLGTINEGTSQTINYTVTVANVGGINVFVLNGVNNPVITFVKGFTYVFDVSDNTNGSHPLRFRTSADASYTDGVSVSGTQGQAGSTVTIVVASDAPSTLKYYCTAHGNAMGNTINVISAVATLARTTILASSNSNNAVSFGTGAKTIFCTLPAGKTVFLDGSGDLTLVGANYNAQWDKTNSLLEFKDNAKATFGDDSDLRISHDGSNSFITEAGTGSLFIGGNALVQIHKAGSSEKMIEANADGNVELYHDNSLKFETTSTGATVTGTLVADGVNVGDNETITVGNDGDLELSHNGNNSFVSDTGTGNLYIQGTQSIFFRNYPGTETFATMTNNGAVELYHDNVKKIETTSDGATITGNATVTGNATITSTADGGPVLNLISNDPSDVGDFAIEGTINYLAENSASEQTTFAQVRMLTDDVTDGTEDGRLIYEVIKNGTLTDILHLTSTNILIYNTTPLSWYQPNSTNFVVQINPPTPTASRNINLPDASGTVLTTGNSDTPTTTTSSSDADFVLVDDGGTMKKITPSNLGITSGGASKGFAVAMAIAL